MRATLAVTLRGAYGPLVLVRPDHHLDRLRLWAVAGDRMQPVVVGSDHRLVDATVITQAPGQDRARNRFSAR